MTAFAATERAVAPAAHRSLRAGAALLEAEFAEIRRTMLLDGCKWDPQVGDVSTLAAFPLLLPRAGWGELQRLAESLACELAAAEAELLRRSGLHGRLGLPRAIRTALRQARDVGPTPAAARVLRFDFHPTRDGWRISEVNSDVPGGFTESSTFARLMSAQYPHAAPAGDPASAWADAVAAAARTSCGGGGVPHVALLAAAGYLEDQQIMAFLARLLGARGCRAVMTTPDRLRWEIGRAIPAGIRGAPAFGAIVRFFQAEWLASLPRRCGWELLFAGGATPVANPGVAILTESKRFPLTWDELSTPLPTWRRLLPETRDPRRAPWRRDDGWLLKTACCNTGDTVSARAWMPASRWRRARWDATLFPGQWVAQRRFETLAIDTPSGPMYPCVGVYAIDGRACGAYARLSPTPVIDFAATDAALLIEPDDPRDPGEATRP